MRFESLDPTSLHSSGIVVKHTKEKIVVFFCFVID
jgi:hypothetical protein